MHNDNQMTQRQLALMQDENRKMRAENMSLRDQLVETKDLLEQIRDRSIEAMETVGGSDSAANVDGEDAGAAPTTGQDARGDRTSKTCIVQ